MPMQPSSKPASVGGVIPRIRIKQHLGYVINQITDVVMLEYDGVWARIVEVGVRRVRMRLSPEGESFSTRDPQPGDCVHFNGTVWHQNYSVGDHPVVSLDDLTPHLLKMAWMLVDPLSVKTVKKYTGAYHGQTRYASVREVSIPIVESESE